MPVCDSFYALTGSYERTRISKISRYFTERKYRPCDDKGDGFVFHLVPNSAGKRIEGRVGGGVNRLQR